ncbi:MAG TPA: patatin-like protein [Pyrinomonadaceae bacterium]|jgi:patatin-related protein
MSDKKIEKEVRFAVVMYGGGSLAIYINGIAQELLKMVRATVDRQNGEDFKNTEKVYRRLALLLSDEDLCKRIANLNDKKRIKQVLTALMPEDNEYPAEGSDQEFEELKRRALKIDKPLVRFIIDVITGSSAGGINGIFLAKALANDQPIEDLKRLWLAEGDFAKLLNDKRSVAGTNLTPQSAPVSLLNSQRMYAKLLSALEQMETANPSRQDFISPNVENLDLFVTVTDFKGVPIKLRHFDRVVYERRHRQSFHFKYDPNKCGGNAANQFLKVYNPFLAFAARSTSAFPLAFEPMSLADIDAVIKSSFPNYSDEESKNKLWKEFFADFKLPQNGAGDEKKEIEANRARFLVDGGALDNKPFGFAIETLLKRQSDVPIDRKLIYIEPSPEFLNESGGTPIKPDALQNVIGQASSLPRYETIREDLERLLTRNRFIERINRLIRNTENDVYELLTDEEAQQRLKEKKRSEQELQPESTPSEQRDKGLDWEKRGLKEVIELKGRCFLPYYRLRLISLTDNVSRFVTRFFGFNEESDYFLAIRSLVRHWREKEFKENTENEKPTVNYFLRHYDLDYRLRRARFVIRKADQLFRFDRDFQKQLERRWNQEQEIRQQQEKFRNSRRDLDKTEETPLARSAVSEKAAVRETTPEGEIRELFPSEIIWQHYLNNRDEALNQLRKTVVPFYQALNEASRYLQCKEEQLAAFRIDKPENADLQDSKAEYKLIKALSTVGIELKNLDFILGQRDYEGNLISADFNEEIGLSRAKDFFDKNPNVYKSLNVGGAELDNYLKDIFETARGKIEGLLNPTVPPADEDRLTKAVRCYLWHYYDNFDEYDQISFPIFYETPVGEADTVEIVRISPHDSQSLINELSEIETRRKLAGDVLYGFGAFLDVRWRQNDIAWGRLDAAERLITALLPTGDEYKTLREVLVREAHDEILFDEFTSLSRDSLNKEMLGVLLHAKSLGDDEKGAKKAVRRLVDNLIENSALEKEFQDVLGASLKEPNDIYEAVGKKYEVDRRLEPKEALRIASRSTQVTGKILEGIAEKNAQAGSRLAWIAHLGTIFWGLVEVAAPNSLLNLLFRYWLKLFYLFEILVIIGGTLLVKPEIQQFGIIALILTGTIHLSVLFLHDVMRGSSVWKRMLAFFSSGVIALLAVAGALFFYTFFYDGDLWQRLSNKQNSLSKLQSWQRILPLAPLVVLFALVFIWREVERLSIRFLGIIVLLYGAGIVLLAVVMEYCTKRISQRCDGLSPILALEFLQTVPCVETMIGEVGSTARTGMKNALLVDSAAFVPLYWAFFIVMSILLAQRRAAWTRWMRDWTPNYDGSQLHSRIIKFLKEKIFPNDLNWAIRLGIAAGILATLGALSDLVENYFSYTALNLNFAEISPNTFGIIRMAANLKFFSIFVSTAILSLIFWRGGGWKALWSFIGFLLMLTAAIGFYGLFDHQYIYIALIFQILPVILIGLAFIILPRKWFLKGY